MKKLRKLLILAVVIFAGVFIVACNGNTEEADKEELANALELLAVRFEEEGDTLRSVTGDLILDTTFGKATITWSSNKEDVVANDGKVTRGEDNATVT